MNLKGIGVDVKNWIKLSEDRKYWRTLINKALNLQVTYAIQLISPLIPMIYYFGDDVGEYRRLCRWKDNARANLKGIGVDVMNCLRIESTGEPL